MVFMIILNYVFHILCNHRRINERRKLVLIWIVSFGLNLLLYKQMFINQSEINEHVRSSIIV